MKPYALYFWIIICMLSLFNCARENDTTGVVTESTNGVAIEVVLPDGSIGVGTQVTIRRADYLAPVSGTSVTAKRSVQAIVGVDAFTPLSFLVDANGTLSVDSLPAGEYIVELQYAHYLGAAQKITIGTIGNDSAYAVTDGIINLGSLALQPLGGFHVRPSESLHHSVAVRIAGFEAVGILTPGEPLALDGLPPGDYPLIISSLSDTTDQWESVPENIPAGAVVQLANVSTATQTIESVIDPSLSDSMAVRTWMALQPWLTEPIWDDIVMESGGKIVGISLSGNGVENNLIDSLHPSIGSLRFIDTLIINHTKIRHIPETVSRLQQLNSFDLSWNELSSEPFYGFVHMKELTNLDLSGNNFDVLPSEIRKLVNVSRLDISNNNLTVVPEELTLLPALGVLVMGNNSFTILPDIWGQLPRVGILSLTNLPLDTIPESFSLLHPDIVMLDLDGCGLTEIPEFMTQFVNIKYLHLKNNSICSPSPSITEWINAHHYGEWEESQDCP